MARRTRDWGRPEDDTDSFPVLTDEHVDDVVPDDEEVSDDNVPDDEAAPRRRPAPTTRPCRSGKCPHGSSASAMPLSPGCHASAPLSPGGCCSA